jgi:flagellar FliL protein
MADRIENSRAGEADKGAQTPVAPPAPQGVKAWLPLIVTIIAMPALAFVTTKFLIIPQVQKSLSGSSAAVSSSVGESGKESGHESAPGNGKVTTSLSKLLVNVSGTMGTRYLMTSLTLVGKSANFEKKIEENRDQLLDLANSTLSNKTISDLEKPGIRNVIRSELISVFNTALGGPVVQEIYITEFAIQ